MMENDSNAPYQETLQTDIREEAQHYYNTHHSNNDLGYQYNPNQQNQYDLSSYNSARRDTNSEHQNHGSSQSQTHRERGGTSQRRDLLSVDGLGKMGNATQTLSQMKSTSSLHTTPHSMHRNKTPINRRESSQHSSIRKNMLSETINKKEEDLLKRLSDLQNMGKNQRQDKQESTIVYANSPNKFHTDNSSTLQLKANSHEQMLSNQDSNKNQQNEIVSLQQIHSPHNLNNKNDYEVNLKQSSDSKRFIERLKDQYTNQSSKKSDQLSPIVHKSPQYQHLTQQDFQKSKSSPSLYPNLSRKRFELLQSSSQQQDINQPHSQLSQLSNEKKKQLQQHKNATQKQFIKQDEVDDDDDNDDDNENLLQDLDYIEQKLKKPTQNQNTVFQQRTQDYGNNKTKLHNNEEKKIQYNQNLIPEQQTYDDRDLMRELEDNQKMFEDMESTLAQPKQQQRQLLPQYQNQQIYQEQPILKKKIKRGSKQKNGDDSKRRKDLMLKQIPQSQQDQQILYKSRQSRQGQPLSPQQRQHENQLNSNDEEQELYQLELEKQQQYGSKMLNRKKWVPGQSLYHSNINNNETDRVLFEFQNQGSEQQWMKINDLLTRIKSEKIDMNQRGQQFGPIEQSVIQTLYSLIRQIQTQKKRLDAGDFDENQRLQKELKTSNEVNFKLEQNIMKLEQQIESLKHQDKKDIINTQKSTQQLEKQVKDMKNKMLVCENTIQKKQLEIEILRAKLEKKLNEDDKHLIKDRQTFEKYFGKQPRPSEEKYVNFLKAYDVQRERNEKQIELLEREVQRLNTLNLELQNENYGLSKGQMAPEEAFYLKRGDGALSLQIKDLEEQNYKLQQALKSNADDYKDLLKEIEKQKEGILQRDNQMEAMEQELKLRPNLANIKAQEYKMQNMQKEISDLQRQNNELHNELIQIRNDKQTHLKDQKQLRTTTTQDQNTSDNIKKGGVLTKTYKGGYLSAGDAKVIIEEIVDIIKLDSDDPVQIIETIRKLEKVVKAVPRMENFIQNISKTLSEDPSQCVSIEQVIPKLSFWKDIVLNQYNPLQQLKKDIIYLLFQRDNIQLMNQDVFKEVERLMIEKEHLKTQTLKETESQRTFNYLLELFEAGDSQTLVDKVNQTFVYVNEFNTFMRIIRGMLSMDQSVTVTTCLNAVRGIVSQAVQSNMMNQNQNQDIQEFNNYQFLQGQSNINQSSNLVGMTSQNYYQQY